MVSSEIADIKGDLLRGGLLAMMTDAIYIEPGARYQCVPDCGFCCGFWNIPIDLTRKDRLLEKAWVRKIDQDLGKRKGHGVFKIIGQKDHAVIERQQGVCSFINERKFCSIHALEGYEAKPVACQQFPFIYYHTPRGLEVFLDHSCPEIIQNLGELVSREEVQSRMGFQEHVINISLPIPLTSAINLEWENFLALEKALLNVLQKTYSFEEKIHCLQLIVSETSKKLSSDSSNIATADAIQAALCRDPAPFLTEIATLPSSRSKRDLYLAILIQLVESVYSGEVGVKRLGMFGLLNKIVRQWKRAGQNDFHVFGFHVNYSDINQIAYQVEKEPCKGILDRYLVHLVRRLVGTGKIPIMKRISIIATNFAMVQWFSRAFAASKQRTNVTKEDLVFAIKVVEKFLGNSLFNKIAKERNFLSNYVNFLYDNPQLPRTMLSS